MAHWCWGFRWPMLPVRFCVCVAYGFQEHKPAQCTRVNRLGMSPCLCMFMSCCACACAYPSASSSSIFDTLVTRHNHIHKSTMMILSREHGVCLPNVFFVLPWDKTKRLKGIGGKIEQRKHPSEREEESRPEKHRVLVNVVNVANMFFHVHALVVSNFVPIPLHKRKTKAFLFLFSQLLSLFPLLCPALPYSALLCLALTSHAADLSYFSSFGMDPVVFCFLLLPCFQPSLLR